MFLLYTLACEQRIVLDQDCVNVRAIEVKREGCELRLVVPENWKSGDQYCVGVRASDIRDAGAGVVANGVQNVSITVRVFGQLPELERLKLFTFEDNESVSLRNVSLSVVVDQPDRESNFLQVFDPRRDDALVLRAFNISERGGACDIRVDGYMEVGKDLNIAFGESQDFNFSTVCVEAAASRGFSSLSFVRPSYQGIQIRADVVNADAQLAILGYRLGVPAVVRNCFVEVRGASFTVAGLFMRQEAQLIVQQVFVKMQQKTSNYYGIVAASKAPVRLEAVFVYGDISAKSEAALLIGRAQSHVWASKTTVSSAVEAPLYALVLYAKLLHMEKCNVILRAGNGDGAMIQYETKLFSHSAIILSNCIVEAPDQAALPLVAALRSGSTLELHKVKGNGCTLVSHGNGDVYGDFEF